MSGPYGSSHRARAGRRGGTRPALHSRTLARFVGYYNYQRLSGVLGWVTPAERYDGTPFTDMGFENTPAVSHLQGWLQEVMDAA